MQVPIRWAAVEGSPLADAGNTTDLLMTRTLLSNAFLNQGGVSLISGLRSRTTFPVIDDPNAPNSTEAANGAELGDVQASDPNTRELRRVRRNARQAYDLPLVPDRRRGILGIAAGRFNGDNGMPANAIGWGSHFRNLFIVEDPRRSSLVRAPVPVTDPLPLSVLDFDAVMVAHESGHVFGLDHRMASDAVMNPTIGSWPVGAFPIFGPGERASMPVAASWIEGARVDPPGVFEPGPVLGDEVLDLHAGDENPNSIPEHLDLDGAATSFNQQTNRVTFELELWGRIPEANLAAPLNYWTLIDRDCNKQTGAPSSLVNQLGLATTFGGAELIVRTTVTNDGQGLATTGQAWEVTGNQVINVPVAGVSHSLLRDSLRPILAAGTTPTSVELPLNDIIVAELDNGVLSNAFTLGSPFKIQFAIQEAGANPIVWDRLDEQEQGLPSVFEAPEYPNAYVVDGQGKPIVGQFAPGALVSAAADGLLPNHPFEVYVGSDLAAQGTAGASGQATIQFSLAANASPGLHALTFVSAGTARAAGNFLEVIDVSGGNGDFDGNGLVDADDLNHPVLGWKARHAELGGSAFLAWQRAYGIAVPVRNQSMATPEPASLPLLMAIAACAATRPVARLFPRRVLKRSV
ncbi:MAG: hypothetical protein DCC67_15315 [Planctomycetota bacterium]|nr:MAG: hypothetical protein DCC67_15315 [Planctomycetota bacterium]